MDVRWSMYTGNSSMIPGNFDNKKNTIGTDSPKIKQEKKGTPPTPPLQGAAANNHRSIPTPTNLSGESDNHPSFTT